MNQAQKSSEHPRNKMYPLLRGKSQQRQQQQYQQQHQLKNKKKHHKKHGENDPNNNHDNVVVPTTSTSKNYIKAETEVTYQKVYPSSSEMEESEEGKIMEYNDDDDDGSWSGSGSKSKSKSKSKSGKSDRSGAKKNKKDEKNKSYSDTNNTNNNSNSSRNSGNSGNTDEQDQHQRQRQHQNISNASSSSTSSFLSSSCPPLFIPSSKLQSIQNQYNNKIPSFHNRLKCNTLESISTHPFLYLTFIITILSILYYTCMNSKNKKRSYKFINPFSFHKRQTNDANTRGEYSALETVYDELLHEFEDEDLSSYLRESDDDSVGSIISQWSEGGTGMNDNGKIELTGFDDGKLSLKETNG